MPKDTAPWLCIPAPQPPAYPLHCPSQVDGRVTRLWKFFFRPGVGTTDRLGFAIPIGDKLDQVQMGHAAIADPCSLTKTIC